VTAEDDPEASHRSPGAGSAIGRWWPDGRRRPRARAPTKVAAAPTSVSSVGAVLQPRGGAPMHASPPFGADYLVTTTGTERWPVTIWVAVRTFLVTAGLLAVPGAGSMVMVAISWLLRG
jgi:hypothetical protein